MRPVAAMLAMLLLSACGAASPSSGRPRPQAAPADAPVELLLASAATDFNTHRPPFPDRVRDVRVGYAQTPEGTRRYMLCGSFLPQGATTGWAPFVTIKTSGYEQWLGAQASVYCGAPAVVWVAGDFTAALQGRLDSLR